VKSQRNLAQTAPLDGLFYCASPLQVLSAYEAREHFNLEQCLLILNSSLSARQDDHNNYLDLVAELGWDRVIILDRSKRSRFWQQAGILKDVENITFSKIFIGEWSSFGRMIYGVCQFDTGFLLDDGVATFRQQREITHPTVYLPWRKRVRDILRDARFLLFGCWKRTKPVISFFSAMIHDPLNGELVVRHDFSNLRGFFAHAVRSSDTPALFLGTHLDSHPEFTFEKLRAMHDFAADQFRDELPFDLYLHRNDTSQRVRQYAHAESYDLVEYREPIEVRLLRTGIQPRLIVSPMSSGLITLKSLFPASRVIALDVRGYMKDPEDLRWVYDLFADHDIEIVKVPVFSGSQ